LEAITDSKDRLLFGECVLEDYAVRFFSQEIRGLRKTAIYGTIFARFDVRRAAGKHKGVKRRNQSAALLLIFQGYEDSLAASYLYGLQVIFGLAPCTTDHGFVFLGAGAPRDAHTGAMGSARLGVSRGHGTPNRSIRKEGRQPWER